MIMSFLKLLYISFDCIYLYLMHFPLKKAMQLQVKDKKKGLNTVKIDTIYTLWRHRAYFEEGGVFGWGQGVAHLICALSVNCLTILKLKYLNGHLRKIPPRIFTSLKQKSKRVRVRVRLVLTQPLTLMVRLR